MPEEENPQDYTMVDPMIDPMIDRRKALKTIAVGTVAASTIAASTIAASISAETTFSFTNTRGTEDNADHAQQHQHDSKTNDKRAKYKPSYFTPQEMMLITIISDLIIPTDEHSPGAREAEVASFIDLMISESPRENKTFWREGLNTLNKLSLQRNRKEFASSTPEQQIALLTEISKNEMKPQTTEEKFFRTIKSMTIDGYYTSEIGIHKDLRYKGNSYLKEYKGCANRSLVGA